jgi:hypothetical protein
MGRVRVLSNLRFRLSPNPLPEGEGTFKQPDMQANA